MRPVRFDQILALASLAACFMAPVADAAPAPSGNTCSLEGKVISVSERYVDRDPGWARSWGIPRRVAYLDVMIDVHSFGHADDGMIDSCEGGPQTFQIRSRRGAPPPGACLMARARFSGDEFSLGTWLDEIEVFQCDAPPNPD